MPQSLLPFRLPLPSRPRLRRSSPHSSLAARLGALALGGLLAVSSADAGDADRSALSLFRPSSALASADDVTVRGQQPYGSQPYAPGLMDYQPSFGPAVSTPAGYDASLTAPMSRPLGGVMQVADATATPLPSATPVPVVSQAMPSVPMQTVQNPIPNPPLGPGETLVPGSITGGEYGAQYGGEYGPTVQAPSYAAPYQPYATPDATLPGATVMPGSTLPGSTLPGSNAAAPLMGDPMAIYDPYSNAFGATPNTDPYAATPLIGGFDPFAPNYGQTRRNPYGPQAEAFGIHGPQPYRFGWREEMNIAINSAGDTSPDIGNFQWNEFNALKGYTGYGPAGWIHTFTPEVNYRWLDGPTGPPGLSADYWRLGLGMSLASPIQDGFSIQFGFAPKLATDFEQNLNTEAWQWDASVVGYLQYRPNLLVVFGVQYWDRVDDFWIPTAGLVWSPSDMVEVRATFPKASIDWFLGTPFGAPTWIYLTGEYHVESYQTAITPPRAVGQTLTHSGLQVEDIRFMLGTRWESGWLTSYVEAGIIADRQIEFARRGVGVADFDVDESFLGRVGFKW